MKFVNLQCCFKTAQYTAVSYLQISSQLQLGGCGFCRIWRRNLSISIMSKCPHCAATASGVVSSGKSGLWVTPAYSRPSVNSFSLFNINTAILIWLSRIACRCVSPGSISGWDNKYSTIAVFLSLTAICSALTPWKWSIQLTSLTDEGKFAYS